MIDAFVRRLAAALPGYLSRQDYAGNVLAEGDRRRAAEAVWSPSRFPTLYQTVPEDIRRPIVWDGKLPGNRDVTHFAAGHLTDALAVEMAEKSGRRAVTMTIAYGAIVGFIWLQVLTGGIYLGFLYDLFGAALPTIYKLAILAGFVLVGSLVNGVLLALARKLGLPLPTGAAVAIGYVLTYAAATAAFASIPGMHYASSFGGVRSALASSPVPYPAWAAEIGAWGPLAGYYVARTIEIVSSVFGLVLTVAAIGAFAVPFFWYFGFWSTLRDWYAEAVHPYATPTRDALLFHKGKADGTRDAEYLAYSRQVQDATTRLATTALIPVGTATGLLRARGDMKAPMRGQLVAYDGESVRTHTLILGDTGTGKTREIVRPLFSRIMAADWGRDHRIGSYITDGKGTLWRDLEKLVAHRDDVRVIGTGPDHYGVDLLAGMSPLQVSSTFAAVAGSVSGKPVGDFWMENASLLVMHTATLALLIKNDPQEATQTAWEGQNPYSLSGIMGLTGNLDALTELVEGYMERYDDDAEQKGEDYQYIRPAYVSLTWLQDNFLQIATEIRSSILANVNVVLGKLSGAGVLTERFINGTCERTCDVDHALKGGIIMVAVGDTEYGMAGRVVVTWLKQRLYTLAKRKLVEDAEGCEKVSCAMFADEFQMLVTTGQDSDSDFWNIARQTGVFLIAATQSVAALKKVIGEDETSNLLNLLRNKIVLSTAELETIDYLRKLAGDLPQGWTPEAGFYSTQAVRNAVEPGRTPPVRATFDLVMPALDVPGLRAPSALDERFLDTKQGDPTLQAQAAAWRQEDKSREALATGVEWTSKLRHDELRLGHGHAFAIIYRAGQDRADIIDLRR